MTKVSRRSSVRDCGRVPPQLRPPRRGQSYDGTDRAVRGRLLAPLRAHEGPVSRTVLEAVWPLRAQRERCLDSLVADGLVEPLSDGSYTLPR